MIALAKTLFISRILAILFKHFSFQCIFTKVSISDNPPEIRLKIHEIMQFKFIVESFTWNAELIFELIGKLLKKLQKQSLN